MLFYKVMSVMKQGKEMAGGGCCLIPGDQRGLTVGKCLVPGYTPKRTENRDSHKYMDIHVHSSQKVETTQVSINEEWINKMCSIRTVDYSAIKWKEVLTQATTWMNLENMVLSERSQTQKSTYSTIPLI